MHHKQHVLLSVGLWSTAFDTFSVSWELCNVVLLVVKVLSFRGQEIKASVHQLHNGQPLLFNSWALYPCADSQSKNRRDALVSFVLNECLNIFWCIGAKKAFFSRLLFQNVCCIMPQNSSESETSQNYLERTPICANRQWLLTYAVVVFEINQIRHGNTQQGYLCAGLFSTGKIFIEALS